MTDTQPQADQPRFAFGRNWASYSELIGEPQIEEAIRGLVRLVPADQLRGRSFLDIGCGSGLHAAAAARLGVGSIVAIDFDPDSVATTRKVLAGQNLAVPWKVEQFDVLDLDPTKFGTFAIVYSWGVLHHTGAMWRAVENAASVVEPGGMLILALYRTTRSDAFWKWEKRWYAGTSRAAQRLAQEIYVAARRLAWALRGVSYRHYVENYRRARGMDFRHDVHDWLGGYPYETALAPEVDRRLTELGFVAERVFACGMTWGVLGSGCDEYVYRKVRG